MKDLTKINQNTNSPQFFKTQKDFRIWFEQYHLTETELWVGFYKVSSGKQSITWPQSVDEALCFGWIDGVRYSIDSESYKIRFSQRRPTSIWSPINIQKVKDFTQQGLMYPAGIAIFEKRTEEKSQAYSYLKSEINFSTSFEEVFKANTKAWEYFQTLAPSYKKPSINWVMSAKQESTQIKRLNELIADSEAGTNKWKENKYTKK